MAYIGNQPTDNFVTFATQNFSTSATSSYTLSHAVSNENEIALFINNVRQHPGSGKAYTASGTALTLSANTASTDVMYCIFLGRAIQSTVPATNSITAAMATNQLKNTPAFEAFLSSNTAINDDAVTKAAVNTEVFDTDGCYDNSTNYRFTPTTAGKYFVYARGTFDDGAGQLQMAALFLYKNGSNIAVARTNFDNTMGEGATPVINTVVDMNGSSDYLEVFAQGDSNDGGTVNLQGNSTERSTNFGAYKLIGI